MPNKTTSLGEFEYMVMLSILSLKDNAYGVTIRHHLKKSIDRDVSIGALYITADRLEKKGLLKSEKKGATQERGGKAKRFFMVTNAGLAQMQKTKNELDTMWASAFGNETMQAVLK